MKQNTLENLFRNWSEGKRRFSKTHETSRRFSELCQEVVAGEHFFENMNFQTWFGIPKDGNIPTRLPATLIPTLEIMEWFYQIWLVPPRFIIYQATTVISQINNIDISDARKASQEMEWRLEGFIENNFPSLRDKIKFRFWETPYDEEIMHNIQSYAKELEWVIGENAWKEFEESRKKHSNSDSGHLLYVAANTYYNRWYIENPFPWLVDAWEVMPIWGRSESRFFQTLLETQQSCRRIFPLITQVWAFPTYYKNPRWDVPTYSEVSQNIFQDTQVHPDIQKDIDILSPYQIL